MDTFEGADGGRRHDGVHGLCRRAGRPALRGVRRPPRLVGGRSRRILVGGLGFLRRHRRQGRARSGRRRQDARRLLLSGRPPELRREPAPPERRRRCHRLLGRGQGAPPDELARAQRSRLEDAAGACGCRRRGRRPGGGDDAEHAGSDGADARHRLAGCDLLVLFAGFRRARRARSVRPDRTQGLRQLRRLLVQRQADRRCRQARCHRSPDAERRAAVDRVLPGAGRGRGGRSEARETARRGARRLRREAGDLRAAAVQPSALHPVLVGDDRRAEVHRAFGRWHPADAPEGAAAALGREAGRPRLLFQHLRLDDVELADVGAGVRGDAAALRRLAVLSERRWSPTTCRPSG